VVLLVVLEDIMEIEMFNQKIIISRELGGGGGGGKRLRRKGVQQTISWN
jgi:hypothetical protein